MKILFVCLGNICRSPMAEFIMKQMVADAGLSEQFEIASAATSTWEIGNPVYPPARRKLAELGIGCKGNTARQMTRKDYDYYDLIIGMEQKNLRDIKAITGEDRLGKIVLLMDFTDSPHDIADPWYTGDFDATWNDVTKGCAALIEKYGRKDS